MIAQGSALGTRNTYDAFGAVVSSSGTWKGPFGYAGSFGYQEDADSSYQLLGHRYYDPSTGRFLTRDPVKDGRNWYSYCENGPVHRIDALGLGWRRIVCGILGGIAGGILSGGNPFGIAAGAGFDGGLGDAGDQAADTGTISWGKAGAARLSDGALGLVGGFLMGKAIKALVLSLEEAVGSSGGTIVKFVHYTTPSRKATILQDGFINPGSGGNVFGWPRTMPPAVQRVFGGQGGEFIETWLPKESISQNGFGALVHQGKILLW